MRTPLLASTSLLALAASVATASAASITTFGYTGGLQTFTASTAGIYDILAFGAQGGGFGSLAGGLGAEIGGDFALSAGQTLSIAVGGLGGAEPLGNGSDGGGGGGGSFVLEPSGTALVIAGGGGGTGGGNPGGIGMTGTAGGSSPSGGGAAGGVAGSGGSGAGGGGGGGLNGNGGGNSNSGNDNGGGGGGYPGLVGGAGVFGGGSGGFGGGGGAGFGGGGGGGYSGGGGGNDNGGGGGGSLDSGTNQVLVAGFNTGDGSVIITDLTPSTPIPSAQVSPACLCFVVVSPPSCAVASEWQKQASMEPERSNDKRALGRGFCCSFSQPAGLGKADPWQTCDKRPRCGRTNPSRLGSSLPR
jgi:hypothetical protein